MGLIVLQIVFFLAGLYIVLRTLLSAVNTFVIPRSVADPITSALFLLLRRLFDLRMRKAQSYAARDRIMAYYAPIGLLLLVPTWMTLILLGYMLIYQALGLNGWDRAFVMSGSSLLTLGFATGDSLLHTAVAFSEACIGLIVTALLISYLPTIYSAFSRREVAVNQLSVRAGTPPSAVEFLQRAHRINALNSLQSFWTQWETWFAEVEESHTSLAALVFFRSPQPDQSWLTAAGAVMDSAALLSAVVDLPRQPNLELCLRAGYLALRNIADYFLIAYNPEPHFPDEPISIAREEFDAAYEQLAASGLPLKPDRDQCWQDFAGWRVNYDRVLLALAALLAVPYAPWSSDRSPAYKPISIWQRLKRGAQ